MGITIFKFVIWGGISSDIRSEILFYGDATPLTRRRKTKFPTVYPTIYLPKWQIWIQLSPKYSWVRRYSRNVTDFTVEEQWFKTTSIEWPVVSFLTSQLRWTRICNVIWVMNSHFIPLICVEAMVNGFYNTPYCLVNAYTKELYHCFKTVHVLHHL